LFPSVASIGSIDVTEAPYLAMGDGVHDDAAAINAALHAAGEIVLAKAAAAAGGDGTREDKVATALPVVFLPKGVYRIGSTLKVPQGVALVGTAHHLSVLVPTRGP
jgi:hypothetical protein